MALTYYGPTCYGPNFAMALLAMTLLAMVLTCYGPSCYGPTYYGPTYEGAAARQVRPRRATVVAPRQAPPSHGRGGADLPARGRPLLVHWAGHIQTEHQLGAAARRRAAAHRRRERGQPGHPDAHAGPEQLDEHPAAGDGAAQRAGDPQPLDDGEAGCTGGARSGGAGRGRRPGRARSGVGHLCAASA